LIASLPAVIVEPAVVAALAEDLGRAGDVTSQACVAADAILGAAFVARAAGVIAGMDCARLTVLRMDPTARFETRCGDGERVVPGTVIARVQANARALLAAERTALNLLCHLSGVATLTAAFVAAIEGAGARIVDTRKTTPGLRALEKHAVRCGGGANHRFGLDDAVLIKDNHVAACGSLSEAVRRARASVGHTVKVEVEIDRLDQLEEALVEAPDIVMLDNFAVDDLARAVRANAGRALLEASGGVSLDTVRAIALAGVDLISVGALTHSAPILDIGLDAG
jgi:nicotinate-nucleotide pyrophosphorylase (carboxylating)